MNKLQCGSITGERGKANALWRTILTLPPNFFSIAMGLAGLAGVWQLAGKFYSLPLQISGTLYLITAVVYFLLFGAFVCKALFAQQSALADLTHPLLGPFNALLPISGMLLVPGLEPYAHQAAQSIFFVFLAATVGLAGWMQSRWILARLNLDMFHSGYYLPTVAGGLIGSDGLARFGFLGPAWAFFGVGVVCWLLLSPIILARLFTRPALPQKLFPTLAIELAPPALAGNAYLTLLGGKADILVSLFIGYAFLMFLIQLNLVPMYRKLPFAPTFWSFTFPFATFTAYVLRWVHLGHTPGSMLLSYLLLGVATLLIGGIAFYSLRALRHDWRLPDRAKTRAMW